MKKYSKKFLANSPKGDPYKDYTEDNAKKAEKRLGIKKKMWCEFSHFFQTNLGQSDSIAGRKVSHTSIKHLINSSFLAGFICGWAEKNKKIK